MIGNLPIIKPDMKKIAAIAASVGYLVTTVSAFAQTPVQIGVTPPALGISPTLAVGTLIANALTIIFVVAALLVLAFLIMGAFQWITSGGDKDAVGKARSRITHALIGLAILALAFLITRVVGQVVNIDILNLKSLPTLGQQCPAGQAPDPTEADGCK